jgi:hypothetical protein
MEVRIHVKFVLIRSADIDILGKHMKGPDGHS